MIILEVALWFIRFQELDCWKSDRRSQEEKTQREELLCQMEDDTAEGLVGRVKLIDGWKAHVPMFKWKSIPEFHLDCACLERATEDRESWLCGLSKGQWLMSRDKECENAQRCVNVDKLVNETITSNVQALMVVESITDVKNTLTGELRSVGGSSHVSKESPISASIANALIERSVREMQSTARTIVAYIEEVYGTMSDPGSASSTWTAEIVGHVVIRSQSSVSDVKTACERRKRKSCRKALVKFDELVMLMTIEKPLVLKGKVDANTIMSDLVDRTDEVVVGTTDRVVKARVVYRVPQEQRDGARDVRSTGNESWQQTSAEIADGELVNAACVASVRSTGKVMELSEDKARWFRIKREAELAKCGFSKDCEGRRVAASGDEVSRLHGKECRERVRVDMMCDDAGQQRLHTAEKRLAPAASAARAEAAQEGQASPSRVDVAQESRDEEMKRVRQTTLRTSSPELRYFGKIRQKRSVKWRTVTCQLEDHRYRPS